MAQLVLTKRGGSPDIALCNARLRDLRAKRRQHRWLRELPTFAVRGPAHVQGDEPAPQPRPEISPALATAITIGVDLLGVGAAILFVWSFLWF